MLAACLTWLSYHPVLDADIVAGMHVSQRAMSPAA
jgi:hypothetical protein